MVRGLRDAGVDASIATTNDDGAGHLEVQTNVWTLHQGVPTYFHDRWPQRPAALREFQWAPGYTSWLERELRTYDGVHVHAVFSALPTATMRLCRKLKVPYLVRPLGQLDPWSLSQKARKKQLYYKWIEQTNIRSAAAVHCTSLTEANNVAALLPEVRVEVIPHGVAQAEDVSSARAEMRRKLSLDATEPVILFLSRWAPKKNIPLLLAALSAIKGQRWTLVLAGTADDGYEQVVRDTIREYGLEGRVLCPGHVSGVDKQLLLQGADLFVLPSLTENFGVAVAEALCAGLPCMITAGVDLAPTLQRLQGGWVVPCTAEDWRAELAKALAADRSEFGGLAKRAKAEFSWSRSCNQLHSLYQRLFPMASESGKLAPFYI
jgi:glycosyltransferase involved in cell wall biosynthesis